MITFQNTMFMGKTLIRNYTGSVIVAPPSSSASEDWGGLNGPADSTEDLGNVNSSTPISSSSDYGKAIKPTTYNPEPGDLQGFFGNGIIASDQVTWTWTVSTSSHYQIDATGTVDNNDPFGSAVTSPFFGIGVNFNMSHFDTFDAQQGTVNVTAVDKDGNVSYWTLGINGQAIG